MNGPLKANYARSGNCCNGRSVAYGNDGATLAGPAGNAPGLLVASFDIAAIRRARARAWGKAQLELLGRGEGRPKLCELRRLDAAFARQNVYGRVGGSAV